MSQKILYGIIALITLTLLLGTNTAKAQIDLPGWFINPPSDSDEIVYGIAAGQTLRDAVALAFHHIADKEQAEVSVISGSNDQPENPKPTFEHNIDNRTYHGIQVSGSTKASGEVESKTNSLDDLVDIFEFDMELKYEGEGNSYYKVTLYEYERVKGMSVSYSYRVSEDERGITFKDLLKYVEEHPGMELMYETSEGDTGYQYFVQLKYRK